MQVDILFLMKQSGNILSSRRKYRRLTTSYKMDNKLSLQYLGNCLPPTVSNISDRNLRNDENYATP